MSFLKKKGFAFCVCVGAALSAALCMLLLLLASFLIYRQVIDQDAGQVVAILCAGISVFAVAAVVTRARGRQALSVGAALAGVVILVALIARLTAGETSSMGTWFLWLAAAVFGGGLLGAVLEAGKDSRRKRRHKRKR